MQRRFFLKEDTAIRVLRITIAVIFIWFGALKMAGLSPVSELISHSLTPFLAAGAGLFSLGVFEVCIGVLIVSNRFLLFTYTLLVLHLLGTFSAFLFGWNLMFSPQFPALTLSGEFVVKNLVLLVAALVVAAHESKKTRN